MMPENVRRATLVLALACLVVSGCRSAPPDPTKGLPVSGRVATGTGVSFEFPAGWVEVPAGTRPFNKVYENRERQLEMRLVNGPSNGLAITTHGDQMRRGLAVDGTVEQNTAVTVDGHPAYRVVVKKKTPTGFGVVVGVTIMLASGRISTVYLSSAGDERVDHRPEIEALLATLRVE